MGDGADGGMEVLHDALDDALLQLARATDALLHARAALEERQRDGYLAIAAARMYVRSSGPPGVGARPAVALRADGDGDGARVRWSLAAAPTEAAPSDAAGAAPSASASSLRRRRGGGGDTGAARIDGDLPTAGGVRGEGRAAACTVQRLPLAHPELKGARALFGQALERTLDVVAAEAELRTAIEEVSRKRRALAERQV